MRKPMSADPAVVSAVEHYLSEVWTANTSIAHTAFTREWLLAERDPLIAGTRIPIYRISALLDGGMTVKEVAEDFPSLTERQIIDARTYAMTNPPSPSIRYPKQSMKRLLRNSGFMPADIDEK
jgi:uncharacterized protein (DUF433 family)